MADSKWLRALDAVTGIAVASSRVLAQPRPGPAGPEGGPREDAALGALGQIEARLAGVVVAALKEAFDRDRARLDLERSHLEAERERADRAVRLELLRQTGERALSQLRLSGAAALALWMVSAVLAAWLPGMGAALPKTALGLGWAALVGALGVALVAYGRLSAWVSAASRGSVMNLEPPDARPVIGTACLLVAGLALVAVAAITAL